MRGALIALLLLAGGDAASNPPAGAPPPSPAPLPSGMAGDLQLPPPPFSQGVFPCSDCHAKDAEVDHTPRELSEHDFKFDHDSEHRWCLDCHDAQDRDKLRLASGQLIDYTESYQLCGQCHGDKYRDWRVGVHGRRTGFWNGKKSYLLCVHCHDPHSPRFKPVKPSPPPLRPEQLKARKP